MLKTIRQAALHLESLRGARRPAVDPKHGYREFLLPFGNYGSIALYKIREYSNPILALKHRKEVRH